MSDPLPCQDPNEAYEVVPLDPIRKERDPHGWRACLCNGIAADRGVVERYATDPLYRASLITKRLWEKNAGR